MDDAKPGLALGPFFTAGLVLLLLGAMRRSRALIGLGVAAVAADFSPPARFLKDRLAARGEAARATAEAMPEPLAATAPD